MRFKHIARYQQYDNTVLVTCLVPLLLMNGARIVWENKHPSSTKYCRPLKFEFVTENRENILKEHERVQAEIDALNATEIGDVKVSHQLLLTMIDGKICSTLAISQLSSSMVCYICRARLKEMNNLECISKKTADINNYSFGMSSLHAWIKCMEYLLHVAYNLTIKKWSTRNPEEKKEKEERKNTIQREFRNRRVIGRRNKTRCWNNQRR